MLCRSAGSEELDGSAMFVLVCGAREESRVEKLDSLARGFQCLEVRTCDDRTSLLLSEGAVHQPERLLRHRGLVALRARRVGAGEGEVAERLGEVRG